MLRSYVDLGLVAETDTVLLYLEGTGIDEDSPWFAAHPVLHPRTDCCMPAEPPELETRTVGSLLDALDAASEPVGDLATDRCPPRLLCFETAQHRWAPVSDADHATVSWLALYRELFDVTELPSWWTRYTMDPLFWCGPGRRLTGDDGCVPTSTHPVLRGAADAALATLLDVVVTRDEATGPSGTPGTGRVAGVTESLLNTVGRVTAFEDRTGAWADLDNDGYRRRVGQVVAAWTARDGEHTAADVAYAWAVLTATRVWLVPYRKPLSVEAVLDYDLDTGAVCVPLLEVGLGDYWDRIVCRDDGYTAPEVGLAVRHLGLTGVHVDGGHAAGVADYIAALRAAHT